jgi:hypothetical protein
MKKQDSHDAGRAGTVVSTDTHAPQAGARNPLEAEMSRRGFLFSLGALALTGCGGSFAEQGARTPRLLATTSTGSSGFIHPGLLHTQLDFDRMAQNYTRDPWNGSWNLLINNSHSSLTRSPAPVAIVYRGADGVHSENYSRLFNDIAAAYACALRWKITGNTAYADKAVQYMNAWSSTLTAISGTSDKYLAAGIYGYEFANVGEIMRTYSGLSATDFAAFQGMMRNIFYPMNHDFLVNHNGADIFHYWANWDICNMASVMAIGVLCDDRTLFDEAVAYFKTGAGNGAIAQAVYYVHPGHLGQWQETGRDQGHNLLGIALMGPVCEMAWNQGVDLYGYDNNRFLMGAEYVAKANLIESGTSYYTVPYVTYSNVDVTQAAFATASQGDIRPIWALVYNHYVNRMGLAAPYSKKFAAVVQPEGGGGNYGTTSGGYDQLGYGTLTCTRDPIASGANPSGLTAYVSAGAVILSWWGGAYATGYTVKRASTSGGPYTAIASGITDLLSHTDTPPADGTWYYVVTADTPNGESAPTNEASAITGVRLHTRLSFDDGSGTVAVDASGNGHTGTLAGGAAWTTGRQGGAVSLDGSTGYVSLPADILVDVSDFTIAAWVYWNGSRASERLFSFGSGTHRYMNLTPRSSAGVARFAISINGSRGERSIDGNAALPAGQWVHVAVTLAGRSATLYVNGAVVGTNPDMFLAPFRLPTTSQTWIGRSQVSTEPYFTGQIDDFRIYRGALSGDDVATLVNGPQDLAASVHLTQQGAVYNRVSGKYAGAVTVTNTGGAALAGPFQLKLAGLSAGITLDNASGSDAGLPYVTLTGTLAPGASLNVPLTFTNPARSLVTYTPAFYRGYF